MTLAITTYRTADLDHIARLLRLPPGHIGGLPLAPPVPRPVYRVRVYSRGSLIGSRDVPAANAPDAIAAVEARLGVKPARVSIVDGKQYVTGWSGLEFRARKLAR